MHSVPPAAAPLHIATLISLSADSVATLRQSPFGPFELHACATPAELSTLLHGRGSDALIIAADAPAEAQAIAADLAADVAVLVIAPTLVPADILAWQQRGAQDVLLRAELGLPTLGLRLRGAIQRKLIERDARTAYATDLETGLPHQQQFIEHVSQLLALREREPAPMAVLALRIEGLATTEARMGREAANALRRKVGVRLRAGVRASDVVASLGDDGFALLLGSILSPSDAGRVGAKLCAALLEPFKVAGESVSVATALGIAQYPQDGTQPEALLRRAVGLAAATPAQGRAGFSNFGEVDGATHGAANDE
ncbi:MAG: GGDEF domain-containing protein [Burkholderiales bacterium]